MCEPFLFGFAILQLINVYKAETKNNAKNNNTMNPKKRHMKKIGALKMANNSQQYFKTAPKKALSHLLIMRTFKSKIKLHNFGQVSNNSHIMNLK